MPSPNGDFSTRLFFVWLACAATATLAPFDFTVPPPGEGWGFTAFSEGSGQQEPIHFVLNMLLFVPLGILVHPRATSRSRLASQFILVGSVGFLISFIVECLQRFLPGRESLARRCRREYRRSAGRRIHKSGVGRRDSTMCKRWRASTPWVLSDCGLVSFMAVSLTAHPPTGIAP